MSSFLQRIRESLFHVYDRKDLRRWEGDPKSELPIYGVYHVMLDTGWEPLVRRQIDNLRKSGLLDATTTFYVSCIAGNQADVECLKRIINSDKLVIIYPILPLFQRIFLLRLFLLQCFRVCLVSQ